MNNLKKLSKAAVCLLIVGLLTINITSIQSLTGVEVINNRIVYDLGADVGRTT